MKAINIDHSTVTLSNNEKVSLTDFIKSNASLCIEILHPQNDS